MGNTVSVSKLSTFNTCAAKYDLSYNLGLRKRSTDVEALSLGSAIHEGIAAGLKAFYEIQDHEELWAARLMDLVYDKAELAVRAWADKHRTEKPQVPIITEDGSLEYIGDPVYHAEFNEMVETAVGVTNRVLFSLDLARNYRVVDDDSRVPLVEYKLKVKLPGTGYTFVGIVDAVLENIQNGLIEVFDWKTRKNFIDDRQQDLEQQLALYQHVLRTMDIDAKVAVIYQIKPQLPAFPKRNKDGSMSRAKIASDWATYHSALVEQGLDPFDYTDMIDKLGDTEFFKPLRFVRLERVTQAYWNNMVEQVKVLKRAKTFPMVLGYPCRNCQFKNWCWSTLHGHNQESLLETEYQIIEGEELA